MDLKAGFTGRYKIREAERRRRRWTRGRRSKPRAHRYLTPARSEDPVEPHTAGVLYHIRWAGVKHKVQNVGVAI